jgi:hypothetical protein
MIPFLYLMNSTFASPSKQKKPSSWSHPMGAQSDPELKNMEPAINGVNLHKLVDMMSKPSEIDFRSCLLLPSVPIGTRAADGGAGQWQVLLGYIGDL